ncbi:MAG: hypothetical protein ACE5IQ_04920 [Candidatus Methylomirabilales bacterium]
MKSAQRYITSAVLLLLLGVSAHAGKRPSQTDLGVPIYPKATFLGSFTEGPAARYLFGSNDLSISVVQFYRAKTGRKPERIKRPDGTETHRFVLRGRKGAVVPDLEVRVNHFPGGFTIPDERGQTRQYRTTIVINKKRRGVR